MDFRLSREDAALQDKALQFAEQVLMPYELKCEEQDGLHADDLQHLNSEVLSWEFNAINHAREDGGQELSIFRQMLVNEQLGRVTGALWDVVFQPAYPMRFGTRQQKEAYLIPTCQGRRRDAYAITEEFAGSDPRQCSTRADRVPGGYRIRGEKWFVTVGDVADYLLVHAHVDGNPELPAIFFIDKNLPGVRMNRVPKYTHHFVYKHPEFIFDDVLVDDACLLGKIGQGFELTKIWFVEARLGIAARCVGGATRVLEIANQFATERVQFGQPIRKFQAIEFMLANMAADILAAKSALYRLCWEIGEGDDRTLAHAKASAAKLLCSEMVGRVCDLGVQIMGGRGYMRENPVERLWRDTRVDRIWEGTSEIQRSIMGGQIERRGTGVYTGWPRA